MKKLFVLLFISTFLLSLYPPTLKAQDLAVLSSSESGKSLGQDISTRINIQPVSYSPGLFELAVFDRRGGVQVGARIIFDDTEKDMLRDFEFVIPGKEINLINILHEKLELKKDCPQTYPILNTPPLFPSGMPLLKDKQLPMMPGLITPELNCNNYYVSKFTTLTSVTKKSNEGLKVRVKASPNLSSKTQESLILFFRTNSYTSKVLMNNHYSFKTIQLPMTAVTIQTGILTRDGLYLKGASFQPGYLNSFRSIEKARALNNEENSDLGTTMNEIMYQGSLRNGDSDVAPMTSLDFQGVYGPYFVTLYLTEIFIGLLVIGAFILGLIILIKRLTHDHVQRKTIILTVIISVLASLVFILLIGFFLMVRTRGGLYLL